MMSDKKFSQFMVLWFLAMSAVTFTLVSFCFDNNLLPSLVVTVFFASLALLAPIFWRIDSKAMFAETAKALTPLMIVSWVLLLVCYVSLILLTLTAPLFIAHVVESAVLGLMLCFLTIGLLCMVHVVGVIWTKVVPRAIWLTSLVKKARLSSDEKSECATLDGAKVFELSAEPVRGTVMSCIVQCSASLSFVALMYASFMLANARNTVLFSTDAVTFAPDGLNRTTVYASLSGEHNHFRSLTTAACPLPRVLGCAWIDGNDIDVQPPLPSLRYQFHVGRDAKVRLFYLDDKQNITLNGIVVPKYCKRHLVWMRCNGANLRVLLGTFALGENCVSTPAIRSLGNKGGKESLWCKRPSSEFENGFEIVASIVIAFTALLFIALEVRQRTVERKFKSRFTDSNVEANEKKTFSI